MKRWKKLQMILVLIISFILCGILIVSFVNYRVFQKKIEVKEAIRELILNVEKAELNNSIEFKDSDTISEIKNENGEKLQALKKYDKIDDFIKIEDLTLEDARKIINNEVDFNISKEGYFLNIENKTE